MKQIIRLLKTYISWPAESTEADQPTVPLAVNSDDIAKNKEPEKNDLMPDIYAEIRAATIPHLKVLDQLSREAEESDGVNPYDTAVLHKKQ